MVESTSKTEEIKVIPEAGKTETQYDKLLAIKDMTDTHDRSYGSMIGAFIGDSLGSFLEFNMGTQREDAVIEGMKMNGGGTWGLAPGQITDDSELAMC